MVQGDRKQSSAENDTSIQQTQMPSVQEVQALKDDNQLLALQLEQVQDELSFYFLESQKPNLPPFKLNMDVELERLADLLNASELFDAEWYASEYEDSVMLGMTPAHHYLKYGAILLRDPSLQFSTAEYLKKHPELEGSRINPLVHCLEAYSRSEKLDS